MAVFIKKFFKTQKTMEKSLRLCYYLKMSEMSILQSELTEAFIPKYILLLRNNTKGFFRNNVKNLVTSI